MQQVIPLGTALPARLPIWSPVNQIGRSVHDHHYPGPPLVPENLFTPHPSLPIGR
jgi:hypothetical protein